MSVKLGHQLWRQAFPGGLVGKESACNARDPGLIPVSGGSAGEGIGYPLQYSWTSLVATFLMCQVFFFGSRSVVSDSLQPHGLHSPWNSTGQNAGVGSLSFLQRIFLTQELNQGLLYCRRILYQLSYQGSPASQMLNSEI